MATKNRIAYVLPIIQIMEILSAKSHKQMRLRLIYRERVGMIIFVAAAAVVAVMLSAMVQKAAFPQSGQVRPFGLRFLSDVSGAHG